MTSAQILYLVGTIVTLVGSYLVARIGAKANTAKVVADKEAAAGQLALNIANRLDREVLDLRRWQQRINRWWPDHDDWDDQVYAALHRLDPDVAKRIGPPPHMPPDPTEHHTI